MKATKMKHTFEIKRTLGTLGIFCMAWTGQGFAAEKPANPPATPAEQAAAKPAEQKDLAKRDQAAIQGKWKVVAMEANGRPAPASILAVLKYEFKGDKLFITPGEPGFTDYTFKLNPSAKPATIDMPRIKPGGELDKTESQGIYTLEGDHLKICFGKNKRPTEMKADAQSGFGQALVELERGSSTQGGH